MPKSNSQEQVDSDSVPIDNGDESQINVIHSDLHYLLSCKTKRTEDPICHVF